MKRFWYTSLVLVTAVAMSSSADAQSIWNRSSEIGSYRPILSPASFGSRLGIRPQDEAPANPDPAIAPIDESVVGQEVQPYADSVMADGSDCNAVSDCDAGGSSSNVVVGVNGLFFTRDSEDDIVLSQNGAGDILRSTDANMNTMGGVEFNLSRRKCNGNGHQFVYWGLYPGEAFAEILGPGNAINAVGLANVNVLPGPQNLQTFFNNADSNYTFRSNEFHNIEFNMLRNGGSYTTRHGRNGTFELLGGFRWFQFNEDWGMGAFSAAGDPTAVEFGIEMENTLLGLQLGGRSDLELSDKWSTSITTKLGFFNNRVNQTQGIATNTGAFAFRTTSGVDDYDYSSSKDDFSMLGELDMALNYRISNKSRLKFGYRVIGISGVALALDQIPNDFTLDAEINSINSNGNLILGGGYAGLEICF